VDEAAAEPTVTAAIEALSTAEGDPGTVAAVDAAEDYDLLWYGTQELGDLI
jgi:hypothetical protein